MIIVLATSLYWDNPIVNKVVATVYYFYHYVHVHAFIAGEMVYSEDVACEEHYFQKEQKYVLIGKRTSVKMSLSLKLICGEL